MARVAIDMSVFSNRNTAPLTACTNIHVVCVIIKQCRYDKYDEQTGDVM